MRATGAIGMGRRWSETRASRPVIVEAGLIAQSLANHDMTDRHFAHPGWYVMSNLETWDDPS